MTQNVITQADVGHVSKAFICVCLYVRLCVCPHDRTKTAETTITKLAVGIVHHEFRYPFNIESKGQRSKSKGYRVQKYISVEGDQVAGVSLHSIECPRLARISSNVASFLFWCMSTRQRRRQVFTTRGPKIEGSRKEMGPRTSTDMGFGELCPLKLFRWVYV